MPSAKLFKCQKNCVLNEGNHTSLVSRVVRDEKSQRSASESGVERAGLPTSRVVAHRFLLSSFLRRRRMANLKPNGCGIRMDEPRKGEMQARKRELPAATQFSLIYGPPLTMRQLLVSRPAQCLLFSRHAALLCKLAAWIPSDPRSLHPDGFFTFALSKFAFRAASAFGSRLFAEQYPSTWWDAMPSSDPPTLYRCSQIPPLVFLSMHPDQTFSAKKFLEIVFLRANCL